MSKPVRFQTKKAISSGRPEDQFQQFGYAGSSPTQMFNPEAEALRIVKFEKTNWETAFAYITEKVMFNMRQVIRQCRKHYWGVFDEPTDPTTGRDKIWEHLTKTFVDYVVTAYDLDSKDINFRAKHPDAYGLTSVVRSIVKNKLDEINFGEQLKLTLRQMAIDGTVVWSTEYGDDAIGYVDQNPLKVRLVDLLNFYIDPTVDSIAEAESVIERIVVPISEFQRLARVNKWKNEDIQGKRNVPRTDTINNPGYNTNPDITFVEIYRRRGLAKEYILTGNPDNQKLVPMEIICSGTMGNWFFHKAVKRLDNSKKGYEEAWLTRVHGRWYGEGIAERLLQKQIHFNILSNIQINRAYLSQLGLFLVRKGSGITPQMLSRLAANGAISVTNLETDIKQFPIQETSPAFYQDQENIYTWAQRYTGANDTQSGDTLPASTPATNAAIQNQAGKNRFSLIKDGIGMFLQRWLKHQAMPAIFKEVTKGMLIRMHVTDEQLQEMDELYVNAQLAKQLDAINNSGGFIDETQVLMERERALAGQKALGKDRYVKLLHDVDITQYDVEPYVTNEEVDKATLLQNLQTLMQTMVAIPGMNPKNIESIIKQTVDVMGLDSSLISMAQPMQPQPQQPGGPNQQSLTNSASGIPQNGNMPARTPIQTPGQMVAPNMTKEPG